MHETAFQIKRAGIAWEDTPPEYTLIVRTPLSEALRKSHIVAEALAEDTGHEVRYTLDGNLQGHYSFPS